ncbi:MAG: TrkA family potassium uptake protein [Armatimonadetes bacterium]|nr:TrkA family potassium uptake protein [Armatimonadota bacterium]NIM24795.1 TrkA family potassium uptake protein [Armatimonadota bacterium]NIM68686.1 TrkA family potassium uptake protein [Armatimonadota bacterium]NIM76981.1 TrkA family potassium uptake protein [Armatimonadota bacterium]NIN06887.1 TrkA family potassium uptake protein [Armatimonadota bacterium]
MRVVILGCGRVGSLLANTMDKAGNEVTIIDENADSFWRLASDYGGEKVTGIGLDEDVLRVAGLDKADAFVAVTNGDNTNVMAGQIAQRRFKVPRVIVRLYDPIRAQTYRKFGLETICTSIIGAGIINDLLTGTPQRPIEEYIKMGPAVEHVLPVLEDKAASSSENEEERK